MNIKAVIDVDVALYDLIKASKTASGKSVSGSAMVTETNAEVSRL